MSTRKMNNWVIGLNTTKFTLNPFFLMAGIKGREKSNSAAKKIGNSKKNSKGCFAADDNKFDGD
ncbi:TPA: hypothetical protein PFE07_003342 [Kluyvera cryocrescens]|nr:hypothetical protein [Kluyvera cryocrescens]